MVTQIAAENWLKEQIGKHLDYDHQYGQQCFDFFNFYFQFITGDAPYPQGYGVSGAKDIWNVPADIKFFTKIPDSNKLIPLAGDILIYGPSWGAGYGHVEVCIGSDANGSHLVGENEHNNPSEGVVGVYRAWSQMAGLIGVLRPKWAPAAPTYITLAQLTQLYKDLLGRAPDSGGIAHYVGHYTLAFVEADIKNSTEYKTRQARLAAEKLHSTSPSASASRSVSPSASASASPAPAPVETVTVTTPLPSPENPPAITVTPVAPAPEPGQGTPEQKPNIWGQWNFLCRFLKWLIK